MAKEHLSRQTGIVHALDVVKAGGVSVAGVAITATPDEINAAADVSVNGGILRVKKLPIAATPTGVEQDTGFDLPAKSVLLDVIVEVTVAEATGGTKTLDVGLKAGESGGDADGFIDGVSVAATGLFRGGFALDGGSAYFASTLRGLLMRSFVAGTNADDRGLYAEKPHMSTAVTAKSVVYTAGSVDFAEFRGAIYLIYLEIG